MSNSMYFSGAFALPEITRCSRAKSSLPLSVSAISSPSKVPSSMPSASKALTMSG